MLCIFNPEHDLCLANGSRHYVPPESAWQFAVAGVGAMQVLYPSSKVVPATMAGVAYKEMQQLEKTPQQVVPWGWNLTLKTALLKQGIPESLMPSDEQLNKWRLLQHRSTVLPLQPDCCAAHSAADVMDMVSRHGAVVLKAPWSGSGRGLRWVTDTLSEQDCRWIDKVVAEQRCVIVEPRRKVSDDFALEYVVEHGGLRFVGFSLFETSHGVYRANLLLPDAEIASRMGITTQFREKIESWLRAAIAPHYEGCVGVDCMRTQDGSLHVGEVNLRHTMGLVAHQYLIHYPEQQGKRLTLQNYRLAIT